MKTVNSFEQLCEIVLDAMKCQRQEKPVLIWFSGNPNRSQLILIKFNLEFVNQNLDIQKENLGGVIKSTKKSAIVFHRYLGQMDDDFLKDALETHRLSKKPVFVLANEYNLAEKPQWVNDAFDEICFNPVLKVVLVSCSSKKKSVTLGKTVRAEDLYTSTLFKKAWAYAKAMDVDGRFILSDKYGVLEPNDLISPYDVSLKKMTIKQKQKWADDVINDLKNRGFDPSMDEFILLAGQVYYQALQGTKAFKNLWSLYQKNGLKGIGYILHFL